MTNLTTVFGLDYQYFNDGPTAYRILLATNDLQKLDPVTDTWSSVNTAPTSSGYQYFVDAGVAYRLNTGTNVLEKLSGSSWSSAGSVPVITTTSTGATFNPNGSPAVGSTVLTSMPWDVGNNADGNVNSRWFFSLAGNRFIVFTHGRSTAQIEVVESYVGQINTVALANSVTLTGSISSAVGTVDVTQLDEDRFFVCYHTNASVSKNFGAFVYSRTSGRGNIILWTTASNYLNTRAIHLGGGKVLIITNKSGVSNTLYYRVIDVGASGNTTPAIAEFTSTVALNSTYDSTTNPFALSRLRQLATNSVAYVWYNNGDPLPVHASKLTWDGSTLTASTTLDLPVQMNVLNDSIDVLPLDATRVLVTSDSHYGVITNFTTYGTPLANCCGGIIIGTATDGTVLSIDSVTGTTVYKCVPPSTGLTLNGWTPVTTTQQVGLGGCKLSDGARFITSNGLSLSATIVTVG